MLTAHMNNDHDVRSYLEKALALVEELDPPSDLRGACFIKATEFYSAKQIQLEQGDMRPGVTVAPAMAIPRG